MAMFKGFKPQGLQKIASRMGYSGRMEEFDNYLQQNPDKQREMITYEEKAQEMARGGAVRKMQTGGATTQAAGSNIRPIGMQTASAMTRAIGENASGGFGNALITTMAIPENGSGGFAPTAKTMAVGEDGDDFNPPMIKTMAVGEDGGGPEPILQPTPFPSPQPLLPARPPANTNQAYVPTIGTNPGQVSAYGTPNAPQKVTDVTATLAQTGAMPVGGVTQPEMTRVEGGQFVSERKGQLSGTPVATAFGADTAQAAPAQETATTQMTASQVTPAVQGAVQANQAAQTDTADPNAKVVAAQQTASSIGDLNAAQGNATLLNNPVQREIQSGELITGVADAEKASKFTEQVQAATATPTEKATVQGQLANLTANFDAGNPPAWAAGTLRAVQAQMAQRGLGASSMAGQAMIQGALEAALPIAQADANIQAQFETQNLSNRQQRAMLAAQQRATFLGQEFDQEFQARVQNSARIGDIANANFTAEQNIALENSRAVNTMNLNNLSNRQALVMGEASALANLDLANLSNNQQAAVQNAQSFLQMEMANLSNEQQTQLFNAQAINQALLSDQSANNAASQFNATSDNQTKQFMANLANNISQFNATQANAQNQYNAGELNTIGRFNTEIRNQRDQFNAQNQLAIAQNNAVWRREIATADTATINRANELNAKAVLDISDNAYNNLWSFYSDTIEWAWKSAESEQDRINALAVAEVSKEAQEYAANASKAAAGKSALGTIIGTIGGALIR
jgi:hypothetical protein